MATVERIARRIVVAAGENVFGDYFKFYNDGKWIVQVTRKIAEVLAKMESSIASHSAYIPKLEEDVGYISDIKNEDFGMASCKKELNGRLEELKKKYAEWEKAGDDEKTGLYDEYNEIVRKAREYAVAFEQSAVNMMRNRYIEDEENVRNPLNVIHSTSGIINVEVAK